jgi:hypothetical protein
MYPLGAPECQSRTSKISINKTSIWSSLQPKSSRENLIRLSKSLPQKWKSRGRPQPSLRPRAWLRNLGSTGTSTSKKNSRHTRRKLCPLTLRTSNQRREVWLQGTDRRHRSTSLEDRAEQMSKGSRTTCTINSPTKGLCLLKIYHKARRGRR